MKRGERKIWRELAETAEKVATSPNYASEYYYKAKFNNSMVKLMKLHQPSNIPKI